MFWASLCPSPGEQVSVLLHTVFCTSCAGGCGCVELGRELHRLCWLWLCGVGTRAAPVVLAVVVWSWDASCVHCVKVTVRLQHRTDNFHTVHTACVPTPHNHSQHNQCRTLYAVVHSLVLLKMGIMMPETCRDTSLIIYIGLVASCWFISLHPIDIFINGNWVDTRWQQYSTHLHTNNTQNNTIDTNST